MNTYYDKVGAEVWLESYIARSRQESAGAPLLQDLELDQVRVQKYVEPESHRLVMVGEGDIEEVQVRVPGILCAKLLPPVTRPIRTTARDQVRGMRQYIKLTGVESSTFKAGNEKVASICQKFELALPASVGAVCSKPYEAHDALDLHTRYFCDRDQVPNQTHVPFSTTEDPYHILEDLRGTQYVRTLDNIVEYCIKDYNDGGSIEYQPVAPVTFKEGDIVEAIVSFICYPLRAGSFRLVPTLRTVALVSAEFRERAEKERDEERQKRSNSLKRVQGPGSNGEQPPTPKRRFLHGQGRGTGDSKMEMQE